MRSQRTNSALWALANRQHGVVTHEQLVELGFNADAVKHRISRGRLHPVRRGIYAIGRPQLTRYGEWMAAVLACGRHAALSHETASTLWRFHSPRTCEIEVSVGAAVDRRPPGIRVHRRANLLPRELLVHRRIPVTSPATTLVDLAARLPARLLEAAINEADKLDLIDPETLRKAVDAMPRRPGIAVLRRALDRPTFTLTGSELERRFLPIARRAGLPPPDTQSQVNGFRVDFYWPDLRLVVETDGLRYHRTPVQQTRDRLRDQAHTAAGCTPLRFTRAQVRYQPRYVEAVLAATVRRLSEGEGR